MDREALLVMIEDGRKAEEFKSSKLAHELVFSRLDAVRAELCELRPEERDKFTALAGQRKALDGIALAIENMIFSGHEASAELESGLPAQSSRTLA